MDGKLFHCHFALKWSTFILSFTAYAADCRGDTKNCLYPHKVEIRTEETALKAFRRDTVCAKYKNNYRSVNTFEQAYSLPADCDNTHSDDPKDWISEKDVELYFSDVPYIPHYSRHHMLQKGEKSPRPRFHILFPINPVTDAEQYKKLKERLQAVFPFCDTEALDAARFLFGTENPKVILHDGTIMLDDFIVEMEEEQTLAEMPLRIPEGERNSTMFRIGYQVARQFGTENEGYEAFLKEAEGCEPPLDDRELDQIWGSAKKAVKKELEALPKTAADVPRDRPIPFDEYELPPFPVDTLHQVLRDYTLAVAKTTQTDVALPAVALLPAVAISVQGKYRVFGKEDWGEPVNIFAVVILPPVERKSAVIALVMQPLEDTTLPLTRTSSRTVLNGLLLRRSATLWRTGWPKEKSQKNSPRSRSSSR